MNRSTTFIIFCLFLVSFYAVLTLRFQFLIIDKDSSENVLAALVLASAIASVCLAGLLKLFAPDKSKLRAALEGVFLTLALLAGVGFVEDTLSEQKYSENIKPDKFALVTGHCGVYAGRGVLRIIHAELSDTNDGALKEFKLNQNCRLSHLDYALKNKGLVCDAKEDGIDCLTRWMGAISEHGYWSRYTRKFFYDQVQKWWPESKKEEALVNYAAKDQELESGRQSILKQAGIDEVFSPKFLLLQQREELSNLELTRAIFKTVESALTDVKANPPPYLFKFKDLRADVDEKLAKIPELQKEVEKLKITSGNSF